MAKSLLEQLKEATEAADLGKVKVILAKMEKQQKAKPKMPATSNKAKTPKSFPASENEPQPKTKSGTGHVNLWVDDGKSFPADIKLDKKNKREKQKMGYEKPYRPKAQKVKVVCSKCKNPSMVWPSEVNRESDSMYVCQQCILGGGSASRAI